MKQNNEQYSNSNLLKSVCLIFLLIGIVLCLIYKDKLFNQDKKEMVKPLSCVSESTASVTSGDITGTDKYRDERNITFDKNGNIDTIEFVGIVWINPNSLAYNEAKNNTWNPDLVTSSCEDYGMIVNTTFNDELREIRSVCKGKYATIDWQDGWDNMIGTTREEIKKHYTDSDYRCN